MLPPVPPGFRFAPTDEELINEYLLKKVSGEQVPPDIVIERVVCGENAQLPEGNGSVEEQYSFVKSKKNQKGTKAYLSAGNGNWKVNDKKKKILDKSGNHIGFKRSLALKRKSKKNLLMVEYSLTRSMIQNNPEGWVLCKIKQSNRSPERPHSQEEEEEGEYGLTNITLDGILPLIEDSHIHEQRPIEFGGGPSHLWQDPPFNPSSEMEIISTSRPTALPALQGIDNKINSLVIDGMEMECFDMDGLLASTEDNPAIAQCPFEPAGGPSHLWSDQSFDQLWATIGGANTNTNRTTNIRRD